MKFDIGQVFVTKGGVHMMKIYSAEVKYENH